ncbi:MAG: acetyl-CoA carboxylase biotin carboxyl carrier protein ['Candidatus Kapabacteria' thiocyanatum]|uniref:Biotin carboxyl carrier protein of acetyl-CoA carboxylase n=1 Tax=Candidatus Kapaibacterium thiocyanatum TaxID=1895771 RepID=A0A1M3KZG0_9BACT|nr:acetyl-CoA carboxylase biotin carboxyl carrier protein ['Candidatus Kapabacteria' thiocyanatum]OJX57946.1 MAG: acetyl-CoA carboxylase, biotin carboxyl carrier protein ['Candidatus Kapabacteria' thiocyanatum]
MDLNYLRRLLKIFDDSTVTELEIEEEGIKIQMSKQVAAVAAAQPAYQVMPVPAAAPAPAAPAVPAPSAPAPAAPSADEGGQTINSPIVGTFYRAPAPDADPFVQVGSHVNVGDPLCIVEAMKLMNEIESEVSGTIVKILVENSQAVEYNQPMFVIKPD